VRTYLPFIKEIIIWLLPFVGLHFYLNDIYNLTLYDLASWWVNNFSSTEDAFARVIAFTILFLLFSLPVTSLINTIFLGILGQRQTLVFLGYSSKNMAMYYLAEDSNRSVFSAYDIDREFNYSFNDVNRLQSFIRMPFAKNTAGIKKQHLHPYTFLSRIMFSVFLLLPALAAIHAVALPAYIPVTNARIVLTGDSMASFDQVISLFYLDRPSATVLFFGSVILAMFFSKKIKNDETGKIVKLLPKNISARNVVVGRPLQIEPIYDKHYDQFKEKHVTYDTGFRCVTFEFGDHFNPPVYVSFKFDKNRYPALSVQVKANIKSATTMEMEVTDNLSLKMIGVEEKGGI
jgi:hypothetical protein